jgi:hypothetical protein
MPILNNYILFQLIVIGVGASAGVWLFYAQRQFEDVYWERHIRRWIYTPQNDTGRFEQFRHA